MFTGGEQAREGAPTPTVLLVTGPAGAGKTSTAEAWATHQAMPAAHFSVDTMSLSVKSGLISGAEATAEARRQWLLAVAATASAAETYASAGVHCGIDAFILPEHSGLWDGLNRFRKRLIVLLPVVEIAVERNRRRQADTGWGVPEWQVRANHEAMSGWAGHDEAFVIDTTTLTIDEVLQVIGGA